MNVNNEAAYPQKNIFLEHVINGSLLDRILFVRYPCDHPLGKKSHIFVVNSKLTEGLSLPLISQKEISKEISPEIPAEGYITYTENCQEEFKAICEKWLIEYEKNS